jgi:hypothetical protein
MLLRAAKLPGAGIGPKLCPGKCSAEKVRPTGLSVIGVVSDARQRLAGARVSGVSKVSWKRREAGYIDKREAPPKFYARRFQ